MTVAHIREREGTDHVQVVFLESARFYRLLRAHPAFDNALALLRNAGAQGFSVEVLTPSLDSDLVEDVRERVEGSKPSRR